MHTVYSLLKDVGSGAFGIVREAEKKSDKSRYAIKTVWKEKIDDSNFLKEEIEILLSIEQENIIQCYEVYEDSECIHYVMELINGGDLFDFIINTDTKKLEHNLALDLFMQMISAIQYLHIEGFMHRDIKPENFLVYYEENKVKLKLIDFGFACHFKPNEKKVDKVGSINYVAPEMLSDDENAEYDCKIDVWAVGICLYNMLAGKQPFADDDVNELARKIREDPVNFNHPVFNTINHNTKKLIESILCKDPEERPSASDIKIIPWINQMIGTDEKPTEVADFKPKAHNVQNIKMLLNTKINIKPEFWALCLNHLSNDTAKSIYVSLLSHPLYSILLSNRKIFSIKQTKIYSLRN